MSMATFIGILAVIVVPVIYYKDDYIAKKYMATTTEGCKIEHTPLHRSYSSLQQAITEKVSPFFDITELKAGLGISTDILLDKFVIDQCVNEITLEGSLETNATQFGSDVSLITKWKLNVTHNVGMKLIDIVSASVDIKQDFRIKGQNIEISLRKEKDSMEFKQEIKASKLGMALYAEVVLSKTFHSNGPSTVNVEIKNSEMEYGNLEEGRITVGKEGIIFTRDVVLDSTSDNKKIFHVYGRASTKGLDVGLGMKFGDDTEAKLLVKIGREIALGFAVAKNVEIFGSTLKAKAKFEAQLVRGSVKLSIGMDGMVYNPMGLKNFAFGNTLLSAGFIRGLPFLEAGFEAHFGEIKLRFYFGSDLAQWSNNYIYMSINRLDVQAICDTIGIDTSLIPEFIKTAGFKDGVTIAITTSSTGMYIPQIGKSIEPGLSVNGKPWFSPKLGINYLMDFSKKYIDKRYIQ